MNHWGLIGHPLSHSFSPAYFRAKFRELNIADTYDLLDIDNLAGIKSKITDLGWNGFNVTIPHKSSILPFLDIITPIAQNIGAVNAVRISDGKWIGTNTDAPGFEKVFYPF